MPPRDPDRGPGPAGRRRPRRRPGPPGAEGPPPLAPGREILAGAHPVQEALRAGRRRLHRLYVRGASRGSSAGLEEVRAAAERRGVPVVELSREALDRLVPPGVPHQGFALEAEPLPEAALEELADAGSPAGRWLLALDGVEDPQNFGALLRVADAAGVAGVVTTRRRAPPLSPAAARASAGASEHVPVARVTNLSRSLRDLKERGFWIYGADADAGEDLWAAPDRMLADRRVLVLGAEGRGLRPGVRAALDAVLRIPMAGAVGSLNVATAAAVLLFEWRRRLPPRGKGG